MPYLATPHTFLCHTFSECVENHAGMQTIGNKRSHGFTEAQLEYCHAMHGGELRHMRRDGERAVVWVLRGGVDKLIGNGGADELYAESLAQPFDERYYDAKKKKVFTKHGRLNNCYADTAQEADISVGKGTVIAFGTVPKLQALREKLPSILGAEAKDLYAETNLYTDVRRQAVGIGFHGDTERSLVVGVRLGPAQMPLRFCWHFQCKGVGDEYVIELAHGDIYVMSHKATGQDWRRSSRNTLRHGVGRKAIVKRARPS